MGLVSVLHRNESTSTNWSEAHLQRDGADQRKSVIQENHDHEVSTQKRFKSSSDSSAPLTSGLKQTPTRLQSGIFHHSDTLSKLFTVKAQFAVRWPVIKHSGCRREVWFPVLHLTIQQVRPQCEMALHLTTSVLHHARHPSCSEHLELICLYRYVQRKTAGPLHFCINLHLRPTAATLTSLQLVTSVINTIWVQDLSPPSPRCSLGSFKAPPRSTGLHSIKIGGLRSC